MPQGPAKSFRDLVVWQRSHALVLDVGLTSQMRRAAVSVPANIAEGFKRRGKPDKARQRNIAQGSLEELQYYFILCADLSYLPADPVGDRANEVGRMLTAYTQQILDSRS